MAPRILVADDDAWILRMVTTVLKKRGYEVDTAADGEEAYQRALGKRPDLLITDVMMPKMDGWTLAKLLRSHPVLRSVPVIFLTALSSDEDRIHGFRLGADDYLPKPFRFEELDLRVAKTLRRTLAGFRDGDDGLDAQVALEAALAGDLGQIGLPMLLTMLEMEGKSGLLEVHHDSEGLARLFLRAGRVVHALLESTEPPDLRRIRDLSAGAEHDGAGDPSGETSIEPSVLLAGDKIAAQGAEDLVSSVQDADCIYYMLRWSTGRFEFKPRKIDMEDRVGASTTQLLMEGARRMDEFNEAARQMDGMGDTATAAES